ncbi:hypothetical protein [Mycoplasmopsis sturni]|uniref:hypothetical protein n=1 Tax=Mycoplasmopsis sturni TaxID=39047 RepID=UPI00055CB106|nr:hypothetical protein [Mycoplasmopsis sturni]
MPQNQKQILIKQIIKDLHKIQIYPEKALQTDKRDFFLDRFFKTSLKDQYLILNLFYQLLKEIEEPNTTTFSEYIRKIFDLKNLFLILDIKNDQKLSNDKIELFHETILDFLINPSRIPESFSFQDKQLPKLMKRFTKEEFRSLLEELPGIIQKFYP